MWDRIDATWDWPAPIAHSSVRKMVSFAVRVGHARTIASATIAEMAQFTHLHNSIITSGGIHALRLYIEEHKTYYEEDEWNDLSYTHHTHLIELYRERLTLLRASGSTSIVTVNPEHITPGDYASSTFLVNSGGAIPGYVRMIRHVHLQLTDRRIFQLLKKSSSGLQDHWIRRVSEAATLLDKILEVDESGDDVQAGLVPFNTGWFKVMLGPLVQCLSAFVHQASGFAVNDTAMSRYIRPLENRGNDRFNTEPSAVLAAASAKSKVRKDHGYDPSGFTDPNHRLRFQAIEDLGRVLGSMLIKGASLRILDEGTKGAKGDARLYCISQMVEMGAVET